jgi:hypothetical protein
MAVAVNNPQQNSASSASSITLSAYAVGAEANRILVVHVSYVSNASETVSSVVFNTSENLTQSPNVEDTQGSTRSGSEQWYLLAPSNATADIVVTFASSVSDLSVQAYYLDDAKQQAPEATGTSVDGTDPLLVSITTVTNGAMVTVGIVNEPDGGTNTNLTPESGTTESLEQEINASYDDRSALGYGLEATAGATTRGWSMDGDNTVYVNAMTAAAWEEDTGAGPTDIDNPGVVITIG